MKIYRQVVALACALMLFAACASVKMTTNTNGLDLVSGKTNVKHVNGKASGLYLLWFPLITGNTDDPGMFMPAFLNDTVNLDAVAGMMTKGAKESGASAITDLTSSRSAMPVLPIPFVFMWYSVQMSGNIVK